ncbi:MAG TPA: glycosyltransferase [Methylomirabilota bacterium]|nr:glycosyltransferase [Methylomirabilota bacterium]
MERTAIIVDTRDRFTPMMSCLERIEACTPEPHELIVVAGGAPERLRREWQRRFGDRVRFILEPRFLNQAEARNIGMRAATTRLAVLMDDDVLVRPGWLGPLLECQRETGAVMVVPVILEGEREIHTAGNTLYVTYVNGRAYGHKELRLQGMPYHDGSNLKRERTDYGELHCQLVEIEPTLRLQAYDENILEVGEVDCGLIWAKAGHSMWFEPRSVVHYRIDAPIEPDDIRLFDWRWNMRAILKGYRHFETKWGIDITEQGRFRRFLYAYNRQLGLLPRVFPSATALRVERGWRRATRVGRAALKPLRAPQWLANKLKARWLGYHDWPAAD